MGFSNTERKTYVAVTNGKFWIPADPSERGTPGIIVRTRGESSPKAGELHYGREYNCYDGVITGLFQKDGNYGTELHIEFDSATLIQVKFYSNYAETFLKCLPNVDLSLAVYVNTYAFVEDDKKRTGWKWMQRGRPVEPGCIVLGKDGNQTKDWKTGALIGSGEVAPDKELIKLPTGNALSNVKRMDWLWDKFGEPVSRALANAAADRIAESNTMQPEPEHDQPTQAAAPPSRPGSYSNTPPADIDDDEIPF